MGGSTIADTHAQNVLDCWHTHLRDPAALAEACKNVLLIQPSSAAAERVFSILGNSFGERQEISLQARLHRVFHNYNALVQWLWTRGQ